MPVIADVWLNDKPFMLEGNGEGLSTSANPAAVGVGGGGEFKDYTQWSQLTLSSWALGAGFKDMAQGGFLYSEVDTRFQGKIKLPPLVDYFYLTDDGSDCPSYFAEDCGTIYMSYGNQIFQWGGNYWDLILTLDNCVTGLVVFDEHLHIGQGQNAFYQWYSTADGSTGTGPHCADGFYSWGGFLYSWCCNTIKYTNGGHTPCDQFTPSPNTPYDPLNPAPGWQWTEIIVGVCDTCECINGLAGVYLGSLGQSRLYVATPSQLYAILPGDVVMSLIQWPGSHIDNGRGMVAFNGSAYATVGDGLFRIAADGSIIQMGINQGEGLPCEVAGKHTGLVPTTHNLITLVNGEDSTLWSWSEGWHHIARVWGKANGGYYSAFYERVFLPLVDGRIASFTLTDQKSSENRYAPVGIIDLGYLYGGLRTAEKDFHDVLIDGEGITPDTPVKVYYSTVSQDGCIEPDKLFLGKATDNTTRLSWPCSGPGRPSGRQLRLWVVLETNDPRKTPVVRNIAVRFLPHVVDQARWHYAIVLNKDCMVDACGTEIEEYDQKEWDCEIRKAIVGVQPVKFVDFDGAEYYVKVMDWARRIHSREVIGEDDKLAFNISWSLTLVQACPESLITC
jgi:hypothetical protein